MLARRNILDHVRSFAYFRTIKNHFGARWYAIYGKRRHGGCQYFFCNFLMKLNGFGRKLTGRQDSALTLTVQHDHLLNKFITLFYPSQKMKDDAQIQMGK